MKRPTSKKKADPFRSPLTSDTPLPAQSLIEQGGDPSVPSLAYVAALPEWSLIRDILGGARRIRAAGELYLPRFTEESDTEYTARNKYAPFVNHFKDSVNSITSKPFSKEVALQGDDISPQIREIAEDVDGHGVSLHKFARDIFKEGVAFGVVGLLVDYPNVNPGSTLADERRLGARPYWSMYRAEDIIALYTEMRAGRKYVKHVRLREDIVKRVGFSEIPVRRVRVLDDDGVNRTWQLWEVGGTGWALVGGGFITLPELPFRLFKPGEREWWTNACVSPMTDLAYLQIEHYQQSSNLKHILLQAAFPMLSGNGISPPIDPATGQPMQLRIGPGLVCFAPPQPGLTSSIPSWTFIEPAGQSIEKLQAQVDKIEEQMAKLGMAPIVRGGGHITATAEAVNAAKAHAAAEAWASDEKDVLEELFVFTAMWLNIQAEPEVYIHTDFGVELRETNENTELMEAHDSRVISRETLWDEWARRGFLGPQFDPEVEEQRLAKQLEEDNKQAAALAAATAAAGGGPGAPKDPKVGDTGNTGKKILLAKDDNQGLQDQIGAA
jgi:hypothetical protein